MSLTQLLDEIASEPALPLLGAAALVVVPLAVLAVRSLTRAGRAVARRLAVADPADLLTYVAACLATAVAAQGMWRFFGDVLLFPPVLRLLMFGFIEMAVVTSAVRARRSVRDGGGGGVDAAAVWVLTSLSAVLSALDARSFAETLFRLAAPLVAAWLWARGMAVERRRVGDRGRIHWRVTLERIAVRCHLADPVDRSAREVDAQRRLTDLALAAKRARDLRVSGAKPRRVRRAMGRVDRAMERAVAHADLATVSDRQDQLLAHLAVLYNTAGLLDLAPAAPWNGPGVPADRREHAVHRLVRVNGAQSPTLNGEQVSTEHRGGEQAGEQAAENSAIREAPIPHARAWQWFLDERRAGRDPRAAEWVSVWGLKPSTARRYRKASVDALSQRPVGAASS